MARIGATLWKTEMLRSLAHTSQLTRRALFHSSAVNPWPAASHTTPLRKTRRKKGEVDSLELIATLAKSKPIKPPRSRKPTEPQVSSNPDGALALPGRASWQKTFPYSKNRDRISLNNPATAAAIAEAYVPAGSKGKVIIEAFPGPGALTRALLALPKSRISKIIVLEENEAYLDWLRPLAQADPRLEIVAKSGIEWDTYVHMEEAGLLDGVETLPWEAGPHPQLQFISHIPLMTMGEQFIAQTFRCVPEKAWLYKYGRVPSSFILSDWVWSRINADISAVTRCKLSVIAEATVAQQAVMSADDLNPYDDHFYPASRFSTSNSVPDNRRVGTPFVAVHFIPLEKQVIAQTMLDKWDYCLRRLFVMKSTPLQKSIGHLAPGAAGLLPKIADPSSTGIATVDVNTWIRHLTVGDWTSIVKAFDEWPFAPEDLYLHASFNKDGRKTD